MTWLEGLVALLIVGEIGGAYVLVHGRLRRRTEMADLKARLDRLEAALANIVGDLRTLKAAITAGNVTAEDLARLDAAIATAETLAGETPDEPGGTETARRGQPKR